MSFILYKNNSLTIERSKHWFYSCGMFFSSVKALPDVWKKWALSIGKKALKYHISRFCFARKGRS